jgi:hypothetical protein
MMPATLHRPPRRRDVLVAQIRATAFNLRGPAIPVAALAAVASVLVAVEILRTGEAIGFHPEHQMFPGMLGLLFPFAVWRGERRFGDGFLWTLPVDRRAHALVRVFAGWVWLMAAVLAFVLWLLGFTLLSGGTIFSEETLHLLPPAVSLAPAPLDPGTLPTVPWSPQPLFWLVPFTAATGMYLLGSALAVGARHPLWWIAGSVLGLLLVTTVGHAAGAEWLVRAPERLVRGLIEAPLGLDALLTARTESLKIEVPLTSGEVAVVWRGVPNVGQWAAATFLWAAAGLAALWGAASRHREQRRT